MNTQTLQKWNKVRLDEIADFQYGYTASSKEDDTGTKLLRITDIVPDLIDWETVPFCDIDEKDAKQYGIKKGDILIARTGATAGYAKFIRRQPEKSVFASYLIRLTMKKADASSEYVGRIIESDTFKQFVASHASGSAQPHANAPILKDFEFLLPDLKTQVSVANILSVYDDLIENNALRIQILEQIAQATYTEWFVNLHFPDHEKVKMTDSGTDFGKIPQGWTVKKLGEKIDISRGRNITKKTVEEGNIPVVAGGLEPAYYHSTANTEAPVVTVSASGANAGFVNLYMENVWASDCSYIDKGVTPFVLYYFLLLKSRQIEVTGLQRGSAQPHVYPKDLSDLLVVDVPDHLLENFEDIVGTIFSFVGNLKKQNKALRDSRNLLLPKLVTGEIIVK
jgi:type I restriction enzyme, S subunit